MLDWAGVTYKQKLYFEFEYKEYVFVSDLAPVKS